MTVTSVHARVQGGAATPGMLDHLARRGVRYVCVCGPVTDPRRLTEHADGLGVSIRFSSSERLG